MPRSARVTVVPGRRVAAQRLLVGRFRGEDPASAGLGAAARAEVERLARTGRAAAAGRSGEMEIVVRDLGRRADGVGLDDLGDWLDARVAEARDSGIERLALILPDEFGRAEASRRFVIRRLSAAAYRFERFRRSEPGARRLREVQWVLPAAAAAARALRRDQAIATAIAAGVAVARELANTPPNEASPAWVARQAVALARRHRFRVNVLGPPEMRRRGMGGLLAVGGGSRQPPRLVRIEAGKGPRTVALVGKGVTFDTGGISIKPAAAMDEMKYDKAGACTVLGILEAFAALDLPFRLRAYLPLAENMPDGGAYRPGDIVRCANGKTVEITNTDAEGRMILADALSWAASEKPDSLLEFSTLTGACVVALGHGTGGLFSRDDVLAGELEGAAARAGERLWRLPMGKHFLADLTGVHADLRNSGGRWGGASSAASFLGEFAQPIERFAHFDIAGPAYVGHDGSGTRGATGYAVALVIEWLMRTGDGAAPRRPRPRPRR